MNARVYFNYFQINDEPEVSIEIRLGKIHLYNLDIVCDATLLKHIYLQSKASDPNLSTEDYEKFLKFAGIERDLNYWVWINDEKGVIIVHKKDTVEIRITDKNAKLSVDIPSRSFIDSFEEDVLSEMDCSMRKFIDLDESEKKFVDRINYEMNYNNSA